MPFSVRDPIPSFPLPLRPGEPEPSVALGSVMAELYTDNSYDLMIDYSRDPVPSLSEADAAWADGLLRKSGHRPH
jgi:hypothetical protein